MVIDIFRFGEHNMVMQHVDCPHVALPEVFLMSRFKTVPIYRQLADELRGLILRGEYTVGDQFLAERDICDRYEVSRITANKSISMLRMEGFLQLRPGKGVFVINDSDRYNLKELISLTRMAGRIGKVITTEVVEFREVAAAEAGKSAARALELGDDEAVFRVRRVRSLDGNPVHFDRRFLRAGFCPGLTEEDVAGSLVDGLEAKWSLTIGAVDQSIRAAVLDADEARVLHRQIGEPGLLLEAVGSLSSGEPLWYEESLFVGDRFFFSSKIEAAGAQRMERVYIEE
jgi:GntR family transcriptional regulator